MKYNHKQTISMKRCSISPVTTEVVLKGQLSSIYQNLFILMRTMPILGTYPAERPAKGICIRVIITALSVIMKNRIF